MERTYAGTVTIRDFQGLDNSVDEVKQGLNTVAWMTGLYPTNMGRLIRLNGKKPHPFSTGHGRVSSLHQLTFSRTNAVVVRCGSHMYGTTVMEAMTDTPITAIPFSPFVPLTGGW